MSRDNAYFLDILLAARDAASYVADMEWSEFEKSSLHQDAVVRALEVIGEAANRVSDEGKENHPEIPWRQLTGMRNRLIHEYFRVDLRLVWDTVKKDLPPLIGSIEKIIPPK